MKTNYKLIISDTLQKFIDEYSEEFTPKKDDLFKALMLTDINQVNVVILGQDPYPTLGDANGLSFSVNRDEKLPKSLNNMYKELYRDLSIKRTTGDLTDWALQGVLLLNTVLSTVVGTANAHRGIGWEDLTDDIIKQVSNKGNVVFILLGKQAQVYEKIIDQKTNCIIKTSHPSPLSVYRGFDGSGIFGKTNEELSKLNKKKIKW